MFLSRSVPVASADETATGLGGVFRIAAVAALLQLACALSITIVTTTLGPKPASAEKYFALLGHDRLAALLRDDFFSLGMIGLYLGTVPGLYVALRRVSAVYAALAAICSLVAVTTCFAIHSGFSMIHLADQYALATSDAIRARLLAAGDAVIASDLWNSSGAYMSGILLQGAGVIFSALMLRSRCFSRVTAVAGLVGNGLDLVQHVTHPFLPSLFGPLMMVAGPFYLVWFVMLARDFYRVGAGGQADVAHRREVQRGWRPS